MVTDLIRNNKAYQYALWCVDDNNDKVGKYVKKQCQEFIDSVENEDSKYYINEKELKAIEGFLKLINIMPRKNAYENLVGFQWFFIVNSLCLRRKENKKILITIFVFQKPYLYQNGFFSILGKIISTGLLI